MSPSADAADTDHRRGEAARRAAEERYEALFNSIDQGYCTIEVRFDDQDRALDYRFLEMSPSFERLTGISNGDRRWMREIAPTQDEHWFEWYGRVALTGEPARFESFSTPLARWWSVYAFRLPDPASRLIGVLFDDITERKRAEAERETRLEQEHVRREAAEAFLAVLSHELRTPVTSIYGTASLLARDPGRPDLPELVTDIMDEAERLRRMIDDLLVLSGVERGFLELASEPVLVQHALRDALADIARRYPDVVVESGSVAALPPVTGDSTALRQILHNLVSNAAKYAGQDGPITVEARALPSHVEVAVLDRGPGLGPDPEALFRLFYRDPGTARRASGTGIGLYVARELADAMGARLEASDRPDGGASFRLTLPAISEG